MSPGSLMILGLVIWFLAGVLPWAREAPDLDAMVNLRESLVFFEDGLGGLLSNRGGNTHPPLVYLLNSFGFGLLGERPFAVYAMGFLLLLCLAHTLFVLFRRSPNDVRAALAAFVVAMNPLVVCCFVFMMSEAVIVLALALSALFFVRRNWVGLALALCGFALVKQTALVFVGAFGLALLFGDDSPWRRRLVRSVVVCLPAGLLTGGWMLFLAMRGGGAWNSYVMGGDAGGNPYLAALNALLGGYASIYFRQNVANAFLVNFNWVVLPGLGLVAWLWVRRSEFRTPLVLLSTLSALVYVAFVFPFPTWTIPRYGLPALFPLLLLGAWGLLQMGARTGGGVLALLGVLFVAAQFASFDPLTLATYGRFEQRGQSVYDTAYSWRGPDRVMFNLQLGLMSKAQNALLRKVFLSGAEVMVGDCHDLKIGEKAWTISRHPRAYPQFPNVTYVRCVHVADLDKPQTASLLQGTRVVLLPPLVTLPLGGVEPAWVKTLEEVASP